MQENYKFSSSITCWVDIIARILVVMLISLVLYRCVLKLNEDVINDAMAAIPPQPCVAEALNPMTVQQYETVIPVCMIKLQVDGSSQSYYSISRVTCDAIKANPNRVCTQLLSRGNIVTLTDDLPVISPWSWAEPLTLIALCLFLIMWVIHPVCSVAFRNRGSKQDLPLMDLRQSLDARQYEEAA